MKKILVLFLLLFLLTGCKLTSNIKVNNDNTVDEKIVITESLKEIEDDPDEYVDNLIDAYELSSYKLSKTTNNGIITVTLQKKYDDVCDYVNNSFFVGKVSTRKTCKSSFKKYDVDLVKVYKKCTDCMEVDDEVIIEYNVNDNNVISSNSGTSNHYWSFSSLENKKINYEVKRHITLKTIFKNKYFFVALLIILLIMISVGIYKLYLKYKENKIAY